MAKPPTSVRSIRLPTEMWAAIAAEAEAVPESVNAAILNAARDWLAKRAVVRRAGRAMDMAERRAPPMPKTPREMFTAPVEGPTVHVELPVYAPKKFNPQPKRGKKP